MQHESDVYKLKFQEEQLQVQTV